MGERIEALLRIPLGILYGIILYILNIVVGIVVFLQFFHTLILGRRHEGMARFANQYASFQYHVNRYTGFATNERPLFGGPGFEEVLPCDFDRKRSGDKYQEIKEAFDNAL
ncbi:DUF4389 domain-containing protein [Thermococcus sp. AM4]|uniref:DUF4389 domain-containing protein n=1 Tax=Thermococcus sp. (strain AM4) TaxID=246969 RepID=UPI0001870B52|nr:DUF4389 domain-containing protein [Thermococcus sp. AM4]EEB74071.1 conserved hypothetical protein [Thermococcus sp. AM4]